MDDDFQVTEDELEKFRSALKKQEFRELLTDYVKEIQDPANKKRYEDEIIEMERRRGQNVKFLNPKPGFVIRIYLEPGRHKIFINICTSDVITEATAVPVKPVGSNKKSGSDWQVPYSLTLPRDDLDKSGKRCIVYDCVYNPKTYQKAQKYARFKQMLVDTAVEAVETRERAKNASGKVKYLTMPYKGMCQSALIRESDIDVKETKRNGASDEQKTEKEEEDDGLPFEVQYPPLKTTKKKMSKDVRQSAPNEPSYTMKYRGEVAMGDYTNERVSHIVKRPKEIVVTVALPGVSSAVAVELDVLEKQLLLEHKNPPYHLDLALSYPVDTNGGKAKFDKTTKCLTITLPIVPPSHPPSLPPSLPTPPLSHVEDELTNQNTDSCESCDLVDDESTNQIVSAAEQNDSDNLTNHSAVTDMTSSNDSTNQITASDHVTWTSKGVWSTPLFTYRQDNERVVYVLQSKGIKSSTIVHHSDEHQFQVMYSCVDDDTQIVNRSLLIRFHDDDIIANTTIDVSAENMVVIVTKADNSQRMWVWFEVGANTQSTEKKLFLTEANVTSEMMAMSDPWGPSCTSSLATATVSNSDDVIAGSHDVIARSHDVIARSHDVRVDIKINTLTQDNHCLEQNGDRTLRNEDSLEWNGDSGMQNEDSSNEASEVTVVDRVVWNGDSSEEASKKLTWNGDRTVDVAESVSQTSMECGHNMHLTNDLLYDLD